MHPATVARRMRMCLFVESRKGYRSACGLQRTLPAPNPTRRMLCSVLGSVRCQKRVVLLRLLHVETKGRRCHYSKDGIWRNRRDTTMYNGELQ